MERESIRVLKSLDPQTEKNKVSRVHGQLQVSINTYFIHLMDIVGVIHIHPSTFLDISHLITPVCRGLIAKIILGKHMTKLRIGHT